MSSKPSLKLPFLSRENLQNTTKQIAIALELLLFSVCPNSCWIYNGILEIHNLKQLVLGLRFDLDLGKGIPLLEREKT